ncbi:MAG: TonB-dependent receptor [Nibricoccus sp.]
MHFQANAEREISNRTIEARVPGRIPISMFALVAGGKLAVAETVMLDPIVVSATRSATPSEQLPFTATVFDARALQLAPALTIDGVLRSVPSFSLFRRSDSLVAHPTTQGVSLRGLGPSGASRTLVLLNGVPLNDPFGGWINWSKVPRETLARVELVRNGGATAWGNAALGGVIQLFNDDSWAHREHLAVLGGAFGTHSVEADLVNSIGFGALELAGREFATDGFPVIAREDRGPVDAPASSRHRWLNATWRQPIGKMNQLTVTARTFSEFRHNGTPLQNNDSHERFISASHSFQWNSVLTGSAVAYVQSQNFSSTFSSVNAARTAEAPASNQFSVPANAVGAAATLSLKEGAGARTAAGIDFRMTRGESREGSSFNGGDFTRDRFAGGRQFDCGVFVQREQPLMDRWRILIGARLDRWGERDGHRRELDRVTGVLLRNDFFPNRAGREFSPTVGLVWQPSDAWRFHASLQRAFRRPTLNELYRPFRQGDEITEANAFLSTEHVRNAELGAAWTHDAIRTSVAFFHNQLTDAASNVTVAKGPGDFEGFGFIPAGGAGRRRLNLDRVRVSGGEWFGIWKFSSKGTLEASYLFNDTKVLRAAAAPSLLNLRLAEVPRQSATVGMTWMPMQKLSVSPRFRYVSVQFDDDENRERLGAYCSLDVSLAYQISKRLELTLVGDNLSNARIETARSTAGVVSTGTPRFIYGGIRFRE